MDNYLGFPANAIDDDGSLMSQQAKIQEAVTHKFDEEHPFLGSIELADEIKESVLALIGKKSFKGKMRLRNQLNDPQLNPNDYINIESPSTVELKRLLSTCQGAVSLKDIKEGEKGLLFDGFAKDEDEIGIEGLEEVDSTIEGIMDKENDGMRNPIKEDANKLQQVFEQFKTTCCEGIKECKKMHFFIGEGEYFASDMPHPGIHVIAMPDYNPEQKRVFTGYINDTILAEFKKQENLIARATDIGQKQTEYLHKYIQALQDTLVPTTFQEETEATTD